MLTTIDRPASLQNVNLRIQRHGEDRVPAADLKISFQLPSAELDSIERGLTEMLYRKPSAEGDQLEIRADASDAFTVLKHPGLEPIKLKGKFPGYEVEFKGPSAVDHPEIEGSVLFLVDVELKKITVDAQDGGTAEIEVTASMPIDSDEVSAALDLLQAGDVLLTLTPPKCQAQEAGCTGAAETVMTRGGGMGEGFEVVCPNNEPKH